MFFITNDLYTENNFMMRSLYGRRKFIKSATFAGLGMAAAGNVSTLSSNRLPQAGKRAGIIGLDTSHSVEFTKELNAAAASPAFAGYQVVAAYPYGSLDIPSSAERIPGYTKQVEELGVEIVGSIPDLVDKVDVFFLETNDGHRHLEQAVPVLKTRKPLFIDKPVAASLADVIAIFGVAKHYNSPVFSSSSLRFLPGVQEVVQGKIGKVTGADTFSPCTIEKTHPDFFWYGVHGVEMLYAVMGTGCRELIRVHTADTDLIAGTWDDGRIGTVRGTRTGKHLFGGTAYGENGNAVLGPFDGYHSLLLQIISFFQRGRSPVQAEDTLEIYSFMEAADESKHRGGLSVRMEEIREQAAKTAENKIRELIKD
jgi:predicted dehydrogenase